MTITLNTITPENYRAVFGLKVAPDQAHFVADNVYSMAQARVFSHLAPLALYAGETPVGFVMYGPEAPGKVSIWRYMIGAERQRQGYGRAGLAAVLRHIQAETPDCREISLSYEPANRVAARLYAGFGFVETGEVDDGELVARLALTPALVALDTSP
jgi:diamine N-acetyltransferase